MLKFAFFYVILKRWLQMFIILQHKSFRFRSRSSIFLRFLAFISLYYYASFNS